MNYNIYEKKSLENASSKVLNGEVIIYPTDTIYGFGVDATNTNAIIKLNKIKKRKQVYSIMVNSIDMMKKYCNLNFNQETKIKKYLPGPYTIILSKKNSDLSDLVSLNLKTVGIRIANHNFCNDLISNINKPIVTTSVNVHGKKSLNEISFINKYFPAFDVFEDECIKKCSKGSTILDFSNTPESLIRIGDGEYSI